VQVDEGGVDSSLGRGKPLENSQRMAILQALLSHMKNGKLDNGALGLVSKQSLVLFLLKCIFYF
jgi:hypothetical protein